MNVGGGEVASFFADEPAGLQVYDEVARLVDRAGPATVHVTKSQVAFRQRRGFCWLWLPAMYLRDPVAPVVMSVALQRMNESARWKQVVEVGGHWMHHLEVRDVAEIDGEVAAWLAEAYACAG